MNKPHIGIPQPTSSDLAYNWANWPAYAEAVRRAGGEPVEVHLSTPAGALLRALEGYDAIVLPGSPADVDPGGYGQERDPASAPADPAREAVDRLLLEHVDQTGKPLLAICFGMQMLNAFRGGTLLQDLARVPTNHSAGPAVAVAHTALVSQGSLLWDLVARKGEAPAGGHLRLSVNSSHHQAVGLLGKGLKVSARCPVDWVVEAIEGVSGPETPDRFLFGVQWHPERSIGSSDTSRSLFSALVQASGRKDVVKQRDAWATRA